MCVVEFKDGRIAYFTARDDEFDHGSALLISARGRQETGEVPPGEIKSVRSAR